MGESTDYTGKYYCSTKGEYRYACDARCYNFCEAYRRSNYSRENMFTVSKEHSEGSGCYITTIMCKILNYEDNNKYLNTLRMFRNNYMKTNSKYIPLLIAYDNIGPIIANELEKDHNSKQIAKTLFERFIIPAVEDINNKSYSGAINKYISMTYSLAELYHINPTIRFEEDKIIDVNNLGHGRRKIKTI